MLNLTLHIMYLTYIMFPIEYPQKFREERVDTAFEHVIIIWKEKNKMYGLINHNVTALP